MGEVHRLLIPGPNSHAASAALYLSPWTSTTAPASALTEADVRRVVAEELRFAEERRSILADYARLTGGRRG